MIPLLLLIIICILCPPIAIGLAVIAGLVAAWYAIVLVCGFVGIACGFVGIACMFMGERIKVFAYWCLALVKHERVIK